MFCAGTILVVGAKEWAEAKSQTPQGFGSAYFYSRPYPSNQIDDWSLDLNLTYLGNSTSAESIAYGFTVACSETCDTGEHCGVKAVLFVTPLYVYVRP
jgi:hypothetical protein